ncbi:MAG: hypothetical protein HY320_06880 [Armatimonadetes bacterium]|nr:hypothetical protein [Armatimonadota bacterium]
MQPRAVSRREWGWVLVCSLAVLAATCLPYAIIWSATPSGFEWPGLLYNFDDHAVYFAWMRQAHDGAFFFRNLFTNAPQTGLYSHLYFWLLGLLARLTGLSLPMVYHLGRLVSGLVALLLVYRLAAFLTDRPAYRRLMWLTVATSAGFGWLVMGDKVDLHQPVDTWQPEAFTFLSLYTNGLFTVSMALMLAVVVGLLRAEERRQARYAIAAGLAGLALADIHTYDVITLGAVWGAYLVARAVRDRGLPRAALGYAALAGGIALPAIAWMLYFFAREGVFRQRVQVPTPTPGFHLYLAGYGLLWILALLGILWSRKRSGREGSDPAPGAPSFSNAALLLVVWLAVGSAVPYIPVAFQRKLVQGLHFPLALWAGLGLGLLLDRRRAPANKPCAGRESARALAALCLAVMALTSVRFMARDVIAATEQNLSSTGVHPVYWPAEELRVMRWMSNHLPRDAVIWCLPVSGALIPAVAGRTVYAGHWGETPDFPEKMREAIAAFSGRTPTTLLRDYLRSRGITHIYTGLLERSPLPGTPGLDLSRLPFLRVVHRDGQAAVYEVVATGRDFSILSDTR